MLTYAVLGATGNVGQSLLSILLQQPSDHVQIHAYCRSKAKLARLSPGIEDDQRVRVFEGGVREGDVQLLAECMRGCRAAFLAIAQSENAQGCTISHDTAKVVVEALDLLDKKGERLPRLLVLSSASLDHSLMSSIPTFLLDILYLAFSNIYDDLRDAEAFFRSRQDLVSATFIRPGALCHDEQRGHALSLSSARSPVSFLDLAAGMVEVAETDGDGGRLEMKGVAVNATGDVGFPWSAPGSFVRGLLFHFLPWTYRVLG